MTATILVLLGTDHHPFDRLVAWTDAAARRDRTTRFVIQHGASAPPRVAEGHAFLTRAQMVDLLRGADGVVCHGGPGTLMDAREAGHVPVCVPRDPSRGEHVDSHQQRFAALVGRSGVATTADTEEEFRQAVDDLVEAARAGRRHHVVGISHETEQARERLAGELDALMRRGPRHVRRARGADLRDVVSAEFPVRTAPPPLAQFGGGPAAVRGDGPPAVPASPEAHVESFVTGSGEKCSG